MNFDDNSMTFMDALGSLDPEPQDVFRYFRELSKIPRGSRNTDQAVGYLLAFAEKRRLKCTLDACNNVVIVKPASPGMEEREPVMLQAHLDMVLEADARADKDPRTHGVSVYTDGDWMKAAGTTLGADDGIGCAMILAVLDDDKLRHPKIEALFTSDEEIGMKGVQRLDGHILKVLTARRCINLDTHEGSGLVLGSTGGLSVEAVLPIHRMPMAGGVTCEVIVSGLKGGHSGRDVTKGGGNALMILSRVLYELFHTAQVRLVSIRGEKRLNVIPSRAEAVIVTTPQGVPRISEIGEKMQEILAEEYALTDPDLSVELIIHDLGDAEVQDANSARPSRGGETISAGSGSSRMGSGTGAAGRAESARQIAGAGGDDFWGAAGAKGRSGRSAGASASKADDSFWQKAAKKQVAMHTNTVVSAGTQRPPEPDVRIYRRASESDTLRIPLDEKSTRSVLSFMMCIPRSVVRMSPVHRDIADVSAVTSQAELKRTEFHVRGMIRSFSETRKYYLAERIQTLAELLNGDIMTFDNYRSWEADAASPLAESYTRAYSEQTGETPVRTVTPASLECGVLAEKLGGADIISVGPTVENAHSTSERFSISSTRTAYAVLRRLLGEL